MTDKILGKYKILKEESSSLKIGNYNDCDYRIEIVSKTPQSGQYSEIAKNINSVSHKNISNLKIEEDNSNFYFVDKDFGEGYSTLKAEWFGSNYISLIRCYLQIIDAVDYIHKKGFYHGNINPKNIIVDRNDNAYLLDFGRCYIYAILNNEPNKQFYAPEQISQNECFKESDIYSLGLCMLNLLIESRFDSFTFLNEYKDFNSLEQIYGKIAKEEEKLDSMNASLLLLIKKMLKTIPSERENLIEVRKELNSLLTQILPYKTFAICISDKVLENYRENHDCERYTEKSDIQSKIDGFRAYWEFGKDKNDREEIRIAIGNLVFCCSGNAYDRNLNLKDHFFCFHLIESPNVIERQQRFGLPSDDKFIIKGQDDSTYGCDNAGQAIQELQKKFSQKKLEDARYETDKKSIASEEELLEAEKKTIDEKKNTRKVILREIDRGKDTLKFEFINEKDDEDENNETEQIKSQIEKDFKTNQPVILQASKDSDKELSGTILTSKAGETVTVQFEKYTVMKNEPINKKNNLPTETDSDQDNKSTRVLLKKGEEYYLSYDYQVEEIIWNKRNRALEELQNGNTQIPNFLRKINRPQEFIKNDLIDVEKFYNDELDVNQKEAVIKSLSLNNGCEVLVLQGPPGTGKTTTITEIVTQILKTRPNEKVLIASQTNQAVDNVLEKICKIEDKILRIGNDPKKMSKIAQNYTPDKVLNKIIKENIQRIDENSVSNKNLEIQKQMQNLQNDFRERLQHITSKLGNSGSSTEKNKDSDLATLFTRNIRLIFGTLLGISSWKNFREMYFDTIIVDEAGRATLSELLVPCIKAKKLILVGDHKQLAPVIDDDVLKKIDDKNEAKTSFFQRLFERVESVEQDELDKGIENPGRKNLIHTLEYNYRAERKICDLYSNAFYEGKLKTTDEVNAKKKHSLSFNSSVVWYDTGRLQNKEDQQKGTGKINNCNARIIEKVLHQLKNEMSSNSINYNIGIITPYKAQMELLRSKLAIKKNFEDYKIDIGTVDSFQGSDRDIIIYDCVRSGKLKQKAKIDFIAEEKRLNVSLSRAKLLLIIVGDMDFLYQAQVSDKNNPFKSIIEYIALNKSSYTIIEEKSNGRKAK
ncbi:MAG: AAA domain-containing protein [Treponema sp.]|nr:AAA domain-containing protein [Treponema sp.]